MAIYRTVQLTFWTDPNVLDDFTPEDKYFYLYLLTNPQTNLCGCYQISYLNTTQQLGYSRDTVDRLLDRFENFHQLIKFCKSTKEVFILNWHKYNWTSSSKFVSALIKNIEEVKSKEFHKELEKLVSELTLDTVSIPYRTRIDTSVTDIYIDNSNLEFDKDLNNNINSNTNTNSIYKDIIDYLNTTIGTNYSRTSKSTIKHINARLSEGFTIEDFKTVIDKKSKEWMGTDFEKFLRPDTLFSTKFESYLNQKINPRAATASKPQSRDEFWDSL